MDEEKNIRSVRSIHFPDSELGVGLSVRSGVSCDSMFLIAKKNGEAFDYWIAQIKDGEEIARHNMRYIKTIVWGKARKEG
jgi:hypothetical protein